MRLIAVSRLTEGMVVARDVATGRPDALPLLRAGTRVRERYLGALAEAGIHAVWIEDELSEGIAPVEPLTPETRRAAQAATAQAMRDARDAVAQGRVLNDRALSAIGDVAAQIAADLAACAPAALALSDLAAASAYTHRHSMQVTVIGLLVAREHLRRHGWVDARGRRRFDDVESRMAKLGFGLLIHDIGKLAVPAEVLEKPGKLTDEEWAMMREHPVAGVALLPTSAVSPLVLSVVRSHHERWDGSGYPDGRAGDAVHVHARIAAVADVFDAVTSERVYRPAMASHEGVDVIADGAGSAFDPEVVASFRRVVMPFPVGHGVTLPDGREAVVADVDPDEPFRPLVRVAGGEERADLRLPAAA